jgi:hypothetical protein
LCFTHWIIPENFLNDWNSLRERMSKFETKLDASTRLVIVNPTVAQTLATSTASHCRLTNRTGEWLFTDAQECLLWLAAKFHQGHATGSRDIKYGWILLGQTS